MTSPAETRFIADVMLGRLAKWLRVMGCDTHYQPFYKSGMIDVFIREGRLLLSRNRRTIEKYSPSLFIGTDHVRTQLQEIIRKGFLPTDNSRWFTRCLVCNTLLKRVPLEEAKALIPEYTYSQINSGIHLCPSCGRYFWPGSHKARMIDQIAAWNLSGIDS
jgi:uncharacterized protein with PIN domain